MLLASPGLLLLPVPAREKTQAQAQAEDLEYHVKAAFLYKFSLFVEWPAESFTAEDSPIEIGVLGDDPFGEILEKTVEEKTAQGRPFVIRRSRTIEELAGAHILFISSSEQPRIEKIIEATRGKPVVAVGDTEDFAESGGLLSFVITDNKVRLKMNLTTAEASPLKISSKLKRICIPVKEE